MKIKKDEKGFVLVLSMFILVAVLLLVASMTKMLQSELNFYNYNKNEKKAFYAAEAGIAYGAEVFKNSTKRILVNNDGDSYYELESYQELNSKLNAAEVDELTWKFIDSNTKIKFNSKATEGGVTETINATYLIYNNIFDSAIASGDKIYLNNNHIVSDGKIKTRNGLEGEIKNSAGEIVEVNPDENFEIPQFDYKELISEADNVISIPATETIEYVDLPEHSAADNIESVTDIAEQFTYINGNLNIDKQIKNINGSGVIVVDGKLSIGSNILINQEDGYEDDYLIIIVRGSIDNEGVLVEGEDSLEGENAITMKGLLYSNGDTVFGNKFDITGSLISGGNLTLNNSSNDAANVDYDPKFIEKMLDRGITFSQTENENLNIYKIISWNNN